jgi:hypothetical protein
MSGFMVVSWWFHVPGGNEFTNRMSWNQKSKPRPGQAPRSLLARSPLDRPSLAQRSLVPRSPLARPALAHPPLAPKHAAFVMRLRR